MRNKEMQELMIEMFGEEFMKSEDKGSLKEYEE